MSSSVFAISGFSSSSSSSPVQYLGQGYSEGLPMFIAYGVHVLIFCCLAGVLVSWIKSVSNR